jgi:hypothetical protein
MFKAVKTIKLTSQIPRTLIGIVMIVFIFSSCSKDELFQASSTASASHTVTGAQVQPAANPVNLSYQAITINHLAARTTLPDYEVTVYSDGNVIFEGRRNTAFIGTKNFKIDERTFSKLTDMFSSSHLFDVPQAAGSVPGSELADVPEVLTSFTNGIHPPVTLTDYNDSHAMPELISLRTRAEALLNIDYLISFTGN